MPVSTRVVLNSKNVKVGRSACIYRTQASCPATCPLMGGGCYGESKAHAGTSLFDVPARSGASDYADVLALIDRAAGQRLGPDPAMRRRRERDLRDFLGREV